MYYLRWDQAQLVTDSDVDFSDPKVLAGIRFRFPWPDEDNIAPGDFDAYDKGFVVRTPVPAGVKHYSHQFRDDRVGYTLNVPCPEGPDSPAGVHRNGYAGPAEIVQQAWRGGSLVTIGACRGCGARFGYYAADAAALLDELLQRAEEAPHSGVAEICKRVAAGYTLAETEGRR
jgi:hypothetical protein